MRSRYAAVSHTNSFPRLQYINVGGPDGIRALAGILKYVKTLE